MQLQIEHTWPKVGVNSYPGQLSIEQTPAQLEIQSTPAKMSLEGEPFRVEIDQYPCRAEEGLKNNFDLLKEAADNGKTMALEGIRRRAMEGARMADIKDHVNGIAALGAEAIFEPPAQTNIAMIPKSRPIINFVGGEKLAIQPGDVEFDAIPASVQIDYQPGSVEIYELQKASLAMKFVGDNVDIQL